MARPRPRLLNRPLPLPAPGHRGRTSAGSGLPVAVSQVNQPLDAALDAFERAHPGHHPASATLVGVDGPVQFIRVTGFAAAHLRSVTEVVHVDRQSLHARLLEADEARWFTAEAED